MNTIAQVVEAGHCALDAVAIIDQLLDGRPEGRGAQPGADAFRHRRGRTEVPRGILYHEYTYDSAGAVAAANCIIPTGQNLANIDDDMRKLVPEIVELGKDEITLQLEMLVRAYDPCISCSVHLLDVDFIE